MFSGAHKTTLMFSDLPEEFMGLRKSIKFLVMIYFSERIQIKTSKGERHLYIVQEFRID